MRPTRRLVTALAAAALLAVATASQAWLLGPAWACLLLVLALAALDVRLTRAEPVVEARCEWPQRLRVQEPFVVAYHFHNPAGRSLELSLLDARGSGLGGDLALGPLALPASGSLVHHEVWTPGRRGLLPLGPLHARSRSALGLFERRLTLRGETAPLRVLPNPGSGTASLSGHADQAGLRAQRTRGESLELDSLRPYAEGDDPRHVDWQASARAQQLIVRTFREERNQSLVIAVDAGRMMATEAAGLCKLDHALNATAALAQAALVRGDRVGFAAFDAEVRCWVPVRHPRLGMAQLLDATLALEARPVESSFRALGELLDTHQRKRSLVVVLTDFVESADALQFESHLARLARRHVVLLVALRDPTLSELEQPRLELDDAALYRRLVLQDLAAERSLVLRRLTRLGVHSLDLRPEQVCAPVLARYLALRRAL
jgi:uncharacterized protein (DUF58 family)